MSETVYDKLHKVRCKIAFMTDAVVHLHGAHTMNEDTTHGYQQIMYSVEDELKEIESLLE